jgi:hypothetical protein
VDLEAQSKATSGRAVLQEVLHRDGSLDAGQPQADDRGVRALDEPQSSVRLGLAEVADGVDHEADARARSGGCEPTPERGPHRRRLHAIPSVDHGGEDRLRIDDVLGGLRASEFGRDDLEVLGCSHECVGREVGVQEALEVRVRPGVAAVDQEERFFGVGAVAPGEHGGGRFADRAVEVDMQLHFRDGHDVVLGREGHRSSSCISAGEAYCGRRTRARAKTSWVADPSSPP